MRGGTCSRKLLHVQLPPTPAARQQKMLFLTSIGTLNELHTEIRSPVRRLLDETTTDEKGSACFLECLSRFNFVQSPVSVEDLHVSVLVQTSRMMETTLS